MQCKLKSHTDLYMYVCDATNNNILDCGLCVCIIQLRSRLTTTTTTESTCEFYYFDHVLNINRTHSAHTLYIVQVTQTTQTH